MIIYENRKECIFCKQNNLETILDKNYSFPLGNFVVDSPEYKYFFMPYNVQRCKNCFTIQNEYIGNLELIYNNNFAGAYGKIRNSMNELFANFILENEDISSISEIGAGNGDLSDIIVEKKNIRYTIIDPSFNGNKNKKNIINSFFENCDINQIKDNTIVMSHVFEHFYDPISILEKFNDINSLKYIYLSFPDLESFIKNKDYHVLNPEHTYYVDNKFIENIFNFYNFKLNRVFFHEKHSVFFEFIKNTKKNNLPLEFPKNKDNYEDVKKFYNDLLINIENVNNIISNTGKPVYIWPCSMHTIFAITFGLNSKYISNVLDNSLLKIDKYLYGYNLKCKSFSEIINNNTDKIVILTGGCYNKEIENISKKNSYNEVLII